jgi:hypothetical protein
MSDAPNEDFSSAKGEAWERRVVAERDRQWAVHLHGRGYALSRLFIRTGRIATGLLLGYLAYLAAAKALDILAHPSPQVLVGLALGLVALLVLGPTALAVAFLWGPNEADAKAWWERRHRREIEADLRTEDGQRSTKAYETARRLGRSFALSVEEVGRRGQPTRNDELHKEESQRLTWTREKGRKLGRSFAAFLRRGK